jgi:hypothetical protein
MSFSSLLLGQVRAHFHSFHKNLKFPQQKYLFHPIASQKIPSNIQINGRAIFQMERVNKGI